MSNFANVNRKLQAALNDIASLFKPDAKTTLIVRFDGLDDQDLLMTDDNLAAVADAVQRGIAREDGTLERGRLDDAKKNDPFFGNRTR